MINSLNQVFVNSLVEQVEVEEEVFFSPESVSLIRKQRLFRVGGIRFRTRNSLESHPDGRAHSDKNTFLVHIQFIGVWKSLSGKFVE